MTSREPSAAPETVEGLIARLRNTNVASAATCQQAADAIEAMHEALTYYAERRNHQTRDDQGNPMLWWNDSYDGDGPGARARFALKGRKLSNG